MVYFFHNFFICKVTILPTKYCHISSNQPNINYANPQNPGLSHPRARKILITPLDWGLGHATRCVPIIRFLEQSGHTIFIAGEGKQQDLLRKEFPAATFLPLRGYRIVYPSYKKKFKLKIASQVVKMIAAIRHEHRWLIAMTEQYHFDAVISDNRFGLYHSSIPSVFLTHQLHIRTGLGKWIDKIIQKLNYSYINRFSVCWVPDCERGMNLAGELSHSHKLPNAVTYIGPISRLNKLSTYQKYDIAIILSGPEPQRSILEDKLLSQLKNFTGTGVFVRGLPGESRISTTIGRVEVFSHLHSEELSIRVSQSGLVISRSGYSTIMDLVSLGKKAILIPTPGQTEQEYLAAHLHSKKIFYVAEQDQFSLNQTLQQAASFPFVMPEFSMDQYKKNIIQFVDSL